MEREVANIDRKFTQVAGRVVWFQRLGISWMLSPIQKSFEGNRMKIESKAGETFELPLKTLSGAVLRELNMHRAIFSAADLSRARITNSNLRGAYFDWADLRDGIFDECNFATACFGHAHLRSASLQNTVLIGAQFEHANLIGANLTGADLGYASLKYANLSGAICLADRLEEAELNGAWFDKTTIWPKGFDTGAAGLVDVTHQSD